MDIKAKEIRVVDISSLTPNPRNPNKHGIDQIERLAKIIKKQGFRVPIVVSNQSGLIVSGHGRYLASVRLKLNQVPVIFQDFDSTADEFSHMVADNALNQWSALDFSDINLEIPNLGPELDLEMLGLKNFTLDFNDRDDGFDPNSTDESKSKKDKLCPHCGGII